MSITAEAHQLLTEIPVVRAAQLSRSSQGGSWRFASLAGILSELSEEVPCGALSFAADLIAEAQAQNEPVAWVAGTQSIFYPPDFSERGIDLSAVAVIRSGGVENALTAVEWLLRCGAMGLVLVDAEGDWAVNDASLGRLQKLAEKSQSAVLFLTRKAPQDLSLGSRISLRGCVSRQGAGPFQIEIVTIKDKRATPGPRQKGHYDGPPGMR